MSINYAGHAEQWDRIAIDGRANDRDVAVRFEKSDELLALATIFRDEQTLNTEIQ